MSGREVGLEFGLGAGHDSDRAYQIGYRKSGERGGRGSNQRWPLHGQGLLLPPPSSVAPAAERKPVLFSVCARVRAFFPRRLLLP